MSIRPRLSQELSGAAKGGAAQDGAKEAHLLEAEEAPRGEEAAFDRRSIATRNAAKATVAAKLAVR